MNQNLGGMGKAGISVVAIGEGPGGIFGVLDCPRLSWLMLTARNSRETTHLLTARAKTANLLPLVHKHVQNGS